MKNNDTTVPTDNHAGIDFDCSKSQFVIQVDFEVRAGKIRLVHRQDVDSTLEKKAQNSNSININFLTLKQPYFTRLDQRRKCS